MSTWFDFDGAPDDNEEYDCTLCKDTGTIMVRPPGYGHDDDLAEYEWCDCELAKEIYRRVYERIARH
jgi:hypothetical protein